MVWFALLFIGSFIWLLLPTGFFVWFGLIWFFGLDGFFVGWLMVMVLVALLMMITHFGCCSPLVILSADFVYL